ncbi:esterase-like activity of phytase family protein [Sphingomonas kaistensis]|uniref:Esterase-like activity of phytase family protein n=1 Tax=Sphingomonas kaistensis TaxID=298708 RepID=A0ABZ2FXR9_9SPHN
MLLASDSPPGWPDRDPRPPRIARLIVQPLAVNGEPGGGVRVTGAWTLTSDDPRVMGLSALAVLPGGRLQALSDSGALVTFAKPGGPTQAWVSDLPAGPGYPTFKKYRDSEAMIVDADGLGRLIAFENRHSLWRFEAEGSAKRFPLKLPTGQWSRNKGIEAIVRDPADGSLLLLHEGGHLVLRVSDSPTPEQLPLTGATGGIADAVRLPDGRIVVAVREIGLNGLANKLAWLEPTRTGYRLRNFATLPLGFFDNIEGLAAEQAPDGRTVLWAITDNDGWRRTLLVRMTLDTTKAPARAGA